jgi:putative membrane protein
MKTTRWLPAAIALCFAPGLALAQDHTADPTKNTETAAGQSTTTTPTDSAMKRDQAEKSSTEKSDSMKASEAVKTGDSDTKKSASTTADLNSSAHTLWKVHQVNQTEIKKDNAQAAPVKKYGNKMITDHTMADRKVASWAKKMDVDLDTQPDGADKAEMDKHAAKMDQLKSLQGAEFDKVYVKAMVDGHKQVIEMLTTARAEAGQRDIKPLLDELLPMIRQHEQLALQIQKGLGGMAAKAQGRRGDTK